MKQIVDSQHSLHILLDIEQVNSLVENDLQALTLAQLVGERFRARYPSQAEERLAVPLQFAEALCFEVTDEYLTSVVEISLIVEVLVRFVRSSIAVLRYSRQGNLAIASLITNVDHYLVSDGIPPRRLGHGKQTFAVLLHLVAADRQQEPLSLFTSCTEVRGRLDGQFLVFS